MKLELCIDSVDEAKVARDFGFNRVELCSALEIGGLTPSYGLIKACAAIRNIETHIMIRPRGGSFDYSKNELEIMKADIEKCASLGASGVVFGILNGDNTIDRPSNELLITIAKSLGLETTFHRAFDFIHDPITGLKSLIELGFNRLLTSGQKPKAIEGKDLIKELVKVSNRQIQIMAGSGVDASNAVELKECNVDALHFTARKKSDSVLSFQMGNEFVPDEEKIKKILSVLG